MSTSIKPTVSNIISLWFGVDTPLRRHRIKLNPELWGACQRTSLTFTPPSKVRQMEQYRMSDKAAFARAVRQVIERSQPSADKKRTA